MSGAPRGPHRPTAGRRPRSLRGIGAGVAILLSLGWVTAVPYLAVRAGGSSAVRLVVVDGSHLVIGVGLVLVLLARYLPSAGRATVDDMRPVSTQRRWLSRSLAVVYAALVVTGALALVPVPAPDRRAFVDAHLVAAAWATVPTVWLVLHDRGRTPRRRRALTRHGIRRLVPAVVATVALLTAAAAWPHGAAPLTQIRAGGGWNPVGPRVFTDRLASTPDGAHLVAGGSGLFVSDRAGLQWHRVGPFSGRDPVLGLGFSANRSDAVFVGTTRGLFAAPALSGPYRQLPLPSGGVHGVIALGSRAELWATTDAGVWHSADDGRHWAPENTGLTEPATAWALTAWRGSILASDLWHVYRWQVARWVPVSNQPAVITLDPLPGRALAASSMGAGIRVLSGGRWSVSDTGIPSLQRGGIHVTGVSAQPGGRVYASTMTAGVDVSLDGGRSWFAGWPRLAADGVVWRVFTTRDHLLAATDQGVFAYDVPNPPAATATWWLFVVASGVAIGFIVLGMGRRPRPDGGRGDSIGTHPQGRGAASPPGPS